MKELVLIGPSNLAFSEVLAVGRWWGRIRDFGYEESSRRLSDTVDENSKEWDSEEDIEAHPESEQQTFSVAEP